MNKFVKVILIISGVLVGIGLVCMLTAFALGGSVKELNDSLPENVVKHFGEFQIDVDISSNGINEDGTSAAFENVRNLSIDGGAGKVEIVRGDVESVELYYDRTADVHAKLDGKELEVDSDLSGSDGLKIVIPEEMELHDLDLDFGAGQIIVNDISFVNLDADVGAGELIVYAPGTKTDYNYEVDYGIGAVVIGEDSFAGIGSTGMNYGANRNIDIDCGAGNVEIHFTED